ncbi:putative NIF3 family GTP cyclohydrolase 1 type 2 [Anaerobacterium chartisolvens]|uniref:GTP cyclohydrolase 1 type 2 homolog n=1 Tax=Anaerobacterium chartisolvens TaxID=1297424 RepID=A0A369BHH6_9FIRM|nr:Nif3-like dinuclear metal center hexameric protein [Anaerobacterium chartisolvens]RCX21010.1 putative NIF3 family GTP cyclohydrolase 1 type 2 [Anaerobacterium chartisolvens]
METEILINTLNDQFDVGLTDVFSNIMPSTDLYYRDYCTNSFFKTYQGLMLSGKSSVKKVAAACFLNDYIVEKAISSDVDFLIVKHPLDWLEFPGKFESLQQHSYKKCVKSGLNVYVIHSALDRHEYFSPSINLVKVLGLKTKAKLYVENDAFGCICDIDLSYDCLYAKIKNSLGLSKLQALRFNDRCQLVAIVSGGGDSEEYLRYASNQGCDTYVTGIAFCEGNEYSRVNNLKFRKLAERLKINILGGSHYATERFGMMAVSEYLESIGLVSTFIEEEPKYKELAEMWE